MTQPIEPVLDAPALTVTTPRSDAPERRLPTFAEMLPATRAFHRNSSKS